MKPVGVLRSRTICGSFRSRVFELQSFSYVRFSSFCTFFLFVGQLVDTWNATIVNVYGISFRKTYSIPDGFNVSAVSDGFSTFNLLNCHCDVRFCCTLVTVDAAEHGYGFTDLLI